MLSFASYQWSRLRGGSHARPAQSLRGRNLSIVGIADIRLKPREVVLTFDDGPMAGSTEKVLAVLDEAGVKATFLMIGAQAQAHPAVVRKVAEKGHTIGSHTDHHPNLRTLDSKAASAEISRGMNSVTTALEGSGHGLAPFFRFPYLADTRTLRRELKRQGVVVLDVDINAQDHLDVSPEHIQRQMMRKIIRRGFGVVLMHDIHARTVEMLPALLAELKARGFTVAHLVPGHRQP